MEELNWKELEQIPIPEGLEERLEKKIDEWEKKEREKVKVKSEKSKYPHTSHLIPLTSYLKITGIAASIVLVFGLGFYFLHHQEAANLAEQDTYHDPAVAQLEAERALNLLAANLNKGMGQLEKAKAISDRTEQTLNKQLNIMK